MPPYRHNVIKMMEQHMHKQLFRHQCKMYITISYNKDFAELQMSWHDYLSNGWCYAKFPFEFNGTTALCIYINKIIKFFNTVLYFATPFGDSPFAEVLL